MTIAWFSGDEPVQGLEDELFINEIHLRFPAQFGSIMLSASFIISSSFFGWVLFLLAVAFFP